MSQFIVDRSKNEIYYRWGGILLLGLLFPLIDHNPFANLNSYMVSVVYGTIQCAIFWNGTMYTIELTNRFFNYQKRLTLSIVMMFVFVTIFVTIAGSAIIWLTKQTGFRNFNNQDKGYNYIISLLITYFISTFYAAAFFFKQWKHHIIKTEKLQRANLEARFETLKTQINPHFLFNSLNTLMYLVVDNQKAAKYIENLSDFMRYLLQTRDKESVSLAEELILVKKFLFIQQNRFGDKMNIEMEIPEEYKQLAIPPLALQMLIENAIKHNVISVDNHLLIRIYAENSYLVVENNLKEKIDKEPSTGVGLSNIKNRFRFLTGEEIKILIENNKFIVKLPLTKQYHENPDS